MKRALAERVKQEKEAAAAGFALGPPSASRLIHSKAPLSAPLINNNGTGRSPTPNKIARTESSSLSVSSLVPPLAISSPHLVVPAAPVTASPRELPALSDGSTVSLGMEIPRRTLPPIPSSMQAISPAQPPVATSSMSTITPTAPPSPRALEQTTSSSSQPRPSPRSTSSPSSNANSKKRPRSTTPSNRAAPSREETSSPIPQSTRPGKRGSRRDNGHESKRPTSRSSGNVAVYKSQRNGSDDDEAEQTTRSRPGHLDKSRNSRCNDEDEDNSNGFYLQHQNRALASELYAYRRRIYLLERERAYRRRECRLAGAKVKEVAACWKGMEVAIGEGVGGLLGGELLKEDSYCGRKSKKDMKQEDMDRDAQSSNSLIPACTGSGTDVETVRSLLLAIKDLASPSTNVTSTKTSGHNDKIKNGRDRADSLDEDQKYNLDNPDTYSFYDNGEEKDDEDLIHEKLRLDELDDLAADVANRAARLRDGIFELLRVALPQNKTDSPSNKQALPSIPLLKERIVHLESELRDAEGRLEEMAKARNEAMASERRVRRGLYRLASGRMKLDEVLKAVEKEDNGVSFMEALAMVDGLHNNNIATSPDTGGVVSSTDTVSSQSFSGTGGGSADSGINGEEASHLKKSLQDIQVVAESREKQIATLLGEREKLQKRINSLLLPISKENEKPGTDEETIRNSSLYTQTVTKLEAAERKVQELEADSAKVRRRWAVMKGDLELAKKTLTEMEGKHERRWNELIAIFKDSDSANPHDRTTSKTSDNTVKSNPKDEFSYVKKIADLEHKLRQSMEAVNRMETLRATLVEAYKMNEMLQSKLDDLKTKNAKMVAEKSAARAAKDADSLTSPQGSSHSSSRRSMSGSSSGDVTIEKLQRDYRRVRKEVAAAVLSKDQAKLKQERAEKERDALMKTNARLLKQSSEKDDMNAKSLSTILHLKQRNEELERENAIIKRKAQAAEQLSLAARLASNAKDRIGEEALREKEMLDETVQKLRRECLSLREEKEQADGLLSRSKSKMASISKDLNKARERCDELAAESNKKEEEKKQMMESLAVVKKEAMESAKKAATAAASTSSQSGVKSEFTMEQLTTQVKYLSDRINCPVCNSREKKCILLRCRHMFCRQCVDENIKNRSRKCPACAQRFDVKDVGEIWL